MENMINGMITEEEKALADSSIDMALEAGASAVQVTLDKAKTEIIALLDGEIDNIRQTGDRALTFKVFADGKYGVFSTNRLVFVALIVLDCHIAADLERCLDLSASYSV